MEIFEIREKFKRGELSQLEALNQLKELMPGAGIKTKMHFLREETTPEEEHILSSPENSKRLFTALARVVGPFCPLPTPIEDLDM